MPRPYFYIFFAAGLLSACAPAGESNGARGEVRFVYESALHSGLAASRSGLSATDAATAESLERLPKDHCYAIHVYSERDLFRMGSLNPAESCNADLAPKALGEVFGLYRFGDVAQILVPVGRGRRFHLIGLPKSTLRLDGRSLENCEGQIDLRPNGQGLVYRDPDGREVPLVEGSASRLYYRGIADIEAGENVVQLMKVLEDEALVHVDDAVLHGRNYACKGPADAPDQFPEVTNLMYRVSATADASTPGLAPPTVPESVAALRYYFRPPPTSRPSPAGWTVVDARISLMLRGLGPQNGCPRGSLTGLLPDTKGFMSAASDGKPLRPNTEYELRVCSVWSKAGVQRISRGEAHIVRTPAACDEIDDGTSLDDFPVAFNDRNGDGIKTLCLHAAAPVDISSHAYQPEQALQLVGFVDHATLQIDGPNSTGFPNPPVVLELEESEGIVVSCSDPSSCRGLSLYNLKFVYTGSALPASKTVLEVAGLSRSLDVVDGVDFELSGVPLLTPSQPLLATSLLRAIQLRNAAIVGALRNLSVFAGSGNQVDLQGVVLSNSLNKVESVEGFVMAFPPRSDIIGTVLMSDGLGIDVGTGKIGSIRGFSFSSTGTDYRESMSVVGLKVGSDGRVGLWRDVAINVDRGHALSIVGGVVERVELLDATTQGTVSPVVFISNAAARPGRLDVLALSTLYAAGQLSPVIDLRGRLYAVKDSELKVRKGSSAGVFVRPGGALMRMLGVEILLLDINAPGLLFSNGAWSADFLKTDTLLGSRIRRCDAGSYPLVAYAASLGLTPSPIIDAAGAPPSELTGLRSLHELELGASLGACP
jgi:hypothetical protein